MGNQLLTPAGRECYVTKAPSSPSLPELVLQFLN